MRINNISYNIYRQNFGVRISEDLKKGLLENLTYMKKHQNVSEKEVFDYADKINEKCKEMREWDSDKDYQLLYREGIGSYEHISDRDYNFDALVKRGKISQKQVEKAREEFKQERKTVEKQAFCPNYKTGWITIPAEHTISISDMDGIGWRGYAYSTETANVNGEMVKGKSGKELIEGFLNITKERYFAKRKASINNFFKIYIGNGHNTDGEEALDRANSMGRDSGEIFKKMFFRKFPEKKADVTPEMLRLTELREKTLALSQREERFG